MGFFNANYSFTLGGISLSVDVDDTLSVEYNGKRYFETRRNMLHYHSIYELFFSFDEGTRLIYEGGSEVFKNEIVCIPPNFKHLARRSHDFRILFSYSVKGAPTELSKSFDRVFSSKKLFSIPLDKPGMEIYLNDLCHCFYNRKSELSGERVTSLIKLIFSYMIEAALPGRKNADITGNSTYLVLNDLISSGAVRGSAISLSAVAKELHLSERQTSRIIRKYYGKPLSEIITEERLNYAIHLLIYTDMPISDISTECNFGSEVYFHALFKKNIGCTPLQYRKRNQKI